MSCWQMKKYGSSVVERFKGPEDEREEGAVRELPQLYGFPSQVIPYQT